MRSSPRSIAAAFLAAAFLFPCRAESPAGASVFPLNGALYAAAPGAPKLFALSGEYRLRALSRAAEGYLGWDSAAGVLRLLDAEGAKKAEWPMDAAFAWVRAPYVLARGRTFDESSGGGKGFSFGLYRCEGGKKPFLAWSVALDCFPADLVIEASGASYLAGADRDDKEHTVYRIDAKGKATKLLSAPKRSDFMRLVEGRDALLAFPSAREKSKALLRFFIADKGGGAFRAVEASGMPKGALCAYGYGFAFGDGFVVPVAMEEGDIAFLLLRPSGGALGVESVARKTMGCYLPLGADPAAKAAYYLARELAAGSETFFLGRYDGLGVTLEKIELR
jgi:hypothetical protein